MTVTRQEEKQRLRRRLQDHAIQLAIQSQWGEAISINKQILTLEEDPATYNRMGKAYMEQGLYTEAYEVYQECMTINPSNSIARKNLSRIDALLARGIENVTTRNTRIQVDQRLFITEAGKTVITSLVDVPRSGPVEALNTSEPVELVQEPGNPNILVHDVDGNFIGHIEPRLAQRLHELLNSGNRFIAAIVQCDTRKIQILIREIFQHASQLGKVSFPDKLSDTAFGHAAGLRYDYETEELLDDEEIIEEPEEPDTDFSSNDDEEEIGLDQLEKDIPDNDGDD